MWVSQGSTVTLFDQAVAFVLDAEGGLSEDVRDDGQLTRWGISKRAHPNVDVETLPREGAISIYKRDYWDRYRLGKLPPALAVATFDAVVNQGPTAIRWLQQALGGLDVDGVIGPKTLAKAAAVSPGPVLQDFLSRRGLHYMLDDAEDRKAFGRGWMLRLFKVYEYARGLG